MTTCFAACGVLVIAIGLAPAAQQSAPVAPQATQPADPLVFNTDRMLVVIRVAEASAVDFEVTMGKVKEVLAKSDKPERQRQAAHWKLLKATDPQDGVLNFFFVLDQVEKGVSYDPFKILGEGLPPEEVRALFEKVGPGLRGISALPLAPFVTMGGGGS
jgi:hypothetical protein